MHKLGLVGKDILHSLSPKIYKDILSFKNTYYLVDEPDEEIINIDLFRENGFSGLNITSPYKKTFMDSVHFDPAFARVGSINTIVILQDEAIAINTDYLALKELMSVYMGNYVDSDKIVLGSGVIAGLIMQILGEWEIDFFNYSRKQNNFEELEKRITNKNKRVFLINACSRNFEFNLSLPSNSFFWDLNYPIFNQFSSQKESIKMVDGFSLLKAQAHYAAKFFNQYLV